MGVYFNGRYYIKPQVATYVNDNALTPVGLVGSNVIGMFGPAKDGVPNQAYLLTSLNDATDIFGEGPLVDGVALAFAGGAQYIWATRVSGTYSAPAFSSVATQAHYAVSDTPAIPFGLYSNAYGKQANGITVNCMANATKGIDVTVNAFGNTILGQGIFYDVLQVKNNSAQSISFSVSSSSVLTVTWNASPGPTITLTEVASTTDLVERIKDSLANIPADPAEFDFIVMKEVPGTYIDEAASGSIASGNTGVALSANVRAVFDWLNSGSQSYVYAEDDDGIFTSASSKTLALLNVADPGTTFSFSEISVGTKGSLGSLNSTAYTGVLAEIYEDLDLDLIVPIVDDYLGLSVTGSADAIFNAVLNHCKSMSTVGSEERIGLVGYLFTDAGGLYPDGDYDTVTTTLIGKAVALNSPYMVVCAPRLKTFDIKGNLKFFNGTYTAAYIAGLIASFPVGEPITNKEISGMQGLSSYFKNRQILQLIDNGVLTIERVGGVLKVVQGVTSWVSDDNFNRKEISVRLVTNYVAKNCRENLKQFIGRKNSPQILQMIKGSLTQVLRELENNEIIVGTTAYPAYRNLIVSADGDVVRVSFECSPVLPINYILITIHATIFKATI